MKKGIIYSYGKSYTNQISSSKGITNCDTNQDPVGTEKQEALNNHINKQKALCKKSHFPLINLPTFNVYPPLQRE
jgi:flagellar biosynthesis/type III secretory pathway ATPase